MAMLPTLIDYWVTHVLNSTLCKRMSSWIRQLIYQFPTNTLLVRALPRREVVTISDHVYERFERLAKRYGLSINDLVSNYLELFNYLASYLDNDVEFL